MSNVKSKSLALASAVAMTLAMPVESSAAVDMFIKIDGVDGESQDAKHENWSDVLAWSWGLSKDSRGKTCIQNLSITKWLDSATPALAQSIPDNERYVFATLVMRSASGTNPLEFLVYDMSNVSVTSMSMGGSGGEDRLTENVTFEFEELTGTYREQNPEGGPGREQQFVIPDGTCN